jgi:hypothetical protein
MFAGWVARLQKRVWGWWFGWVIELWSARGQVAGSKPEDSGLMVQQWVTKS